jgi:hypothetical protein
MDELRTLQGKASNQGAKTMGERTGSNTQLTVDAIQERLLKQFCKARVSSVINKKRVAYECCWTWSKEVILCPRSLPTSGVAKHPVVWTVMLSLTGS